MSNQIDRLGLLEQKVTVMQNEFNQVLQEIYKAIDGIMTGNELALAALQGQIDDIVEGNKTREQLIPEDDRNRSIEL